MNITRNKYIISLIFIYLNSITFLYVSGFSKFPRPSLKTDFGRHINGQNSYQMRNGHHEVNHIIEQIGSSSNFDPEIIFKQINMHSSIDILDLPYTGTLPKNSNQIDSFKIAIDYSNSTHINPLQLVFLRVFIIPQALQRIASVIRVKQRERLKFSRSKIMKCDDKYINVPNDIIDRELDADILLFVGAKNLSSDTFAMTAACSVSDISKRNIAANVLYNIEFLDYTKQNIEEAVETVEHELIHALVFDVDTFQRFPLTKSKKKISFRDNFNRFYLRSDFLIQELQDFFQCKKFNIGSNYQAKTFQQFLWKMKEEQAQSISILKKAYSIMN